MTSTTAVLAGAITLLTLFRPGLCEEYRWSGPVSGAIIAPTDSNGYEITGASLQGGLVDLRYGQASIDTGGTGIVLDWNDETVFTLNGKTSDPASLTNLVNEGSGLTVAVRYDPSSGLMGWCDAVDGVSSVPAVNLTLEPWKPILTPGERLTIKLDRSEAERLGLKNPTLFVPGMTHGIAFRLTDARFWSAELPIKTGWNWKGLPLFVTDKNGVTLRGKQISVSATGPSIGQSGPRVASEHLTSIPGWFELEGNLMFIDSASIRLKASDGAQITQIVPRRGRVDFLVEVVGSGTYQVEATVADLTGREAKKTWFFNVRR